MNIQLDDTQLSNLIIATSILVLFIVQLILCFKSESGFLKALPLLLSLGAAITFIVLMYSIQGWDAIGYLVLALLSGAAFVACLLAWIIYGIAKAGDRKRR